MLLIFAWTRDGLLFLDALYNECLLLAESGLISVSLHNEIPLYNVSSVIVSKIINICAKQKATLKSKIEVVFDRFVH